MTDRTWRLVDSGSVPPAESAALDEAMLDRHSAGEVPDTLHFYTRSRPTVSLGYFQKAAEAVDLDECGRRGVAVVRRRSGGRTIFTDPGQLVYAVVVGSGEMPGSGASSFEPVCSAIARAISSLGVAASYRPVNDIEVGGRKVSGSAQLRRRGSVLQHGTVLVDADLDTMDAVLRHAPIPPSARVASLSRLLPARPDTGTVKALIAEEIGRTFGAVLEPSGMTEREAEKVRELVGSRYGRREWNLRL